MGGTTYQGRDVNLNKLANRIKDFLRNDGFTKTKISKDSYGHYFDIQGIKSGWWRTISSSRKALHVIIEGAPNRFDVNIGVGEWGKNIGVAALTAISTMGIGLLFQGAGVGSNILFERKINKFIESEIDLATVDKFSASKYWSSSETTYVPTRTNKTRKPKIIKPRPRLPKETSRDSFVRLKNYIVNVRAHSNYQPVMIRTLLKNNGYCAKDSIVNDLHLYNTSQKKDWTFYKYVPVFGVLDKNGVVTATALNSKGQFTSYSLIGSKNLSENQKNTLIELCDQKISQTSITQPAIVANMFDADGNYVSRTERNAEEEDSNFESDNAVDGENVVDDTKLSEWENKIKRKLEHSDIEFESGDTRNFTDLHYKNKKLSPYNPDFILRKYKMNKRSVILEAHDTLTTQILQQHYAFLEERGDQYHIIIIVKKQDYEKWKTLNDKQKFADEIVPESKLPALIKDLYFSEERKRTRRKSPGISKGKSKIMTCISDDCKKEFEVKNFYDEFGEIREGELNQFCPECSKHFE